MRVRHGILFLFILLEDLGAPLMLKGGQAFLVPPSGPGVMPGSLSFFMLHLYQVIFSTCGLPLRYRDCHATWVAEG
jgi:hypothetical protein